MQQELRIVRPLLLFTLAAVVAVTLLSSAGYLPVADAEAGDTQAPARTQDAETDSQAPKQGNAEPVSAKPQFEQTWKAGLVQGAYLSNSHLNDYSIVVEVQGNTAILTGAVETEAEKDLAEQIALSISGIDDVHSELEVNANAGREATMWIPMVVMSH